MEPAKEITIPLLGATLGGRLRIPHDALGLVNFVHGSGSSRFSRRNNFVADLFAQRRIATLLFDLLTENEELIADDVVLELNKSAMRSMKNAACELETVPSATHLFGEPEALEEVADKTARWLVKKFKAQPAKAIPQNSYRI